MGFNAKAFSAAFLNQLSTGIQSRLDKAEEFEKEERDKAKRNLQVYNQRKAKIGGAKIYAEAIRKALGGGADANRMIMYYAKDGLPSLQAAYKAIVKEQDTARENMNYEFGPEQVAELLNVPAEFKTDPKMSMSDFWDRTFNLTNENERVEPSESSEGRMGNIFMAAMGIGAKDRVKRRLANEQYIGDQTIGSLNELAEKEEYRDIFGGAFSTASLNMASLPTVLDSQTVNRVLSRFNAFKTAYSKDSAVSEFVTSVGLNPLEGEGVSLLGAIQNGKGFTTSTGTEITYKQYKDWVTEKTVDEVIKEQFGGELPNQDILNQLPFLGLSKAEETGDGTETGTETKDDKKEEMPDLTKTVVVPTSLDKSKIATKEDGFVYVITLGSMETAGQDGAPEWMGIGKDIIDTIANVGDYTGFIPKPKGVAYKVPVSKAHLINDLLVKGKKAPSLFGGKEDRIIAMATNKKDAYKQLESFAKGEGVLGGIWKRVTKGAQLNLGQAIDPTYGIRIKDLEIPDSLLAEKAPVAKIGDKDFEGYAITSFINKEGEKEFSFKPVYKGEGEESYSVASAPRNALKFLADKMKGRGVTVLGEENYELAKDAFFKKYMYLPSEEELQEYLK